MIDIQKAKQELKKYVSNYDIQNNRIRVKIGHSQRNSKKYEIIRRRHPISRINRIIT